MSEREQRSRVRIKQTNICLARWLLLAAALSVNSHQLLRAQDLAPRAYLIAPIHTNAVTLTYSFLDGSLLFSGSVPITGATAKTNIQVMTAYHTFRLLGRSANITASLPYGVGNFRGIVFDAPKHTYRSGLLDSAYRFSFNLIGGPAMDRSTFAKWRQKTLLGVSLKVVAPTGQYDPTALINFGGNRWAFKPELGFSRRRNRWVLDAYGAEWFFTANNEFFSHNQFNPGVIVQTQKPVSAFEGHLSYDVKPRFWASLDGNFWYGGTTSLNGLTNPDTLQRNSQLGATVSLPVSKHQSLKFSYTGGAIIRYGGNYKGVSAAWQYTWFGRPK